MAQMLLVARRRRAVVFLRASRCIKVSSAPVFNPCRCKRRENSVIRQSADCTGKQPQWRLWSHSWRRLHCRSERHGRMFLFSLQSAYVVCVNVL